MKTWENPKLCELNAQFTEAGGNGGDGDGVLYKVGGYTLIGTSGPELPLPKV